MTGRIIHLFNKGEGLLLAEVLYHFMHATIALVNFQEKYCSMHDLQMGIWKIEC